MTSFSRIRIFALKMLANSIAAQTQRTDFFKRVAALWQARHEPSQLNRIDYLRRLASLASRLAKTPGPASEDLDLFRRLVMNQPQEIRRRLLDANIQRIHALTKFQRRLLRTLEVWPDLLSPLRERRYEPSHSGLLGYHMNQQHGSAIAGKLLRAFLGLVGCPAETLEADELIGAVVTSEAWVPPGRLDIRIETTGLLVFVEVKIDASEGLGQLPDYRSALDEQRGTRVAKLVYLTLPGAEGPRDTLDCTHISFEQLLVAWLPFSNVDGKDAGYLARYLKSVALLLGATGLQGFEQWTFAEQRTALALVSSIEPRSSA